MSLRYTSFMPEWSDQRFLQTVFDETRVLRKPLRGIISGYHVLPYVLVGPSAYDQASKTVEVRGRIRVSPRLVLCMSTNYFHRMPHPRPRQACLRLVTLFYLPVYSAS